MSDSKTISRSPFKFLDSYGKEDRSIFFGREAEIEELYERVFESNLILLYGASGTGKTSLIDCGLANQFESTEWLPISIRRSEYLPSDMDTAIQKKAVKVVEPSLPLHQKVHSLYLDYFKTIYLIFDQFEEIFISGDKGEQQVFFNTIDTLLEEEQQCKVILSMREEYLAHLSNFELILPYLFDNRQRVEPMSRIHLQEVITGTAEKFDIKLEGRLELANQIINNIKDPKKGIELANLQIYLDKLYRNAQERPLLFDQKLVEQARLLEDVLSEFLEGQLAALGEELKNKGWQADGLPMQVLFALVTDEGTKANLEEAQLKQKILKRWEVDEKAIDFCIKRFNELRILRIMSDDNP